MGTRLGFAAPVKSKKAAFCSPPFPLKAAPALGRESVQSWESLTKLLAELAKQKYSKAFLKTTLRLCLKNTMTNGSQQKALNMILSAMYISRMQIHELTIEVSDMRG